MNKYLKQYAVPKLQRIDGDEQNGRESRDERRHL